MSFPLKNYLVLFFLGATLGAGCDLFHNLTGTSYYPSPDLFGLCWWVFPLFGTGVCVISALHIKIDDVLNEPLSSKNFFGMLGGLLFFMFVYFLSGILKPIGNFYILIVLLFLSATFWIVCDRTIHGLIAGILVGMGGSFVESSLHRLGVFHYGSPDFFGVPMWLGFLYFVASIAVGQLARYLRDCSIDRVEIV